MKRKKNLKGFTLVELIVVVAVFGILLAASINLLSPLNHIFKSTSQYSNSSAVVDNVRMVIEDNLRYANRMYVFYGADDSTADPNSFIDTKVANMRTEFHLGTGDRKSFAKDEVFAMRIHNPTANGFKDISSTAEKPGKISIYKYVNGTRTSDSKEWAVSEALYNEYAFSLSFGIKDDTWNTTEKTVAGIKYDLINSVEYEPVSFASPSNFTLSLDIFEKDYANRADKANSDYTLCRTYVNNVVTLSLVNLSTSHGLDQEDIVVNTISGVDHVDPKPTRYQFENLNATSGSDSADIYIIYTVPDLT